MSADAITQGDVSFSTNELGITTIEFQHPLSNSLPGKVLAILADTITEVVKDSNK
jgi:methylglutaconyl-CoA hydratase